MATTNDFQNTDLLQIFEALGGSTTPATDLLQKIFDQVSAKRTIIDLGLQNFYSGAILAAKIWANANPDYRVISMFAEQDNLSGGTKYAVALLVEPIII